MNNLPENFVVYFKENTKNNPVAEYLNKMYHEERKYWNGESEGYYGV